MANRLFDAPDLVEVEPGDGPWSALGIELQATRAAMTLLVSDPCSEASVYVAGAADASSPKVYKILAFAASVSARRNFRCMNGEELEIVSELLADGGVVSAAEYVLWFGAPGWDPNLQPSLHSADTPTVARSTNIEDTVAAVVYKHGTLTVVPDYCLHLGIQAAFQLSARGYTELIDVSGQLRLKATGAPIVVSPYYPTNAVGITGPIRALIGSPSAFQTLSPYNNRSNIRGDQLIALEFDPSTSVRALDS